MSARERLRAAIHDPRLDNHPQPPRYWRDEIGPELRPAVSRYLNAAELSASDIEVLRLYVSQWVDSPVWELNPYHDDNARAQLTKIREDARNIQSRADLDSWTRQAIAACLDPW